MTSVSKNVYIDKLDDIANKYNNTYYRTIKMKSIDVKLSAYIDFVFKNNERYPIFNIGNIVRISKYKNVLQKVTLQIGLKKILQLRKLKILYRGLRLLIILTSNKLLDLFTKKNCKK